MWVLYAALAALFSALSTVLLKMGSRRADASVTTVLRTLVTVICLWAFIISNGLTCDLPKLSGSSLVYLLIYGALLFTALLCFHISLKHGTVTSVSALGKVYPLCLLLYTLITAADGSYAYIKIISSALLAVGIILTALKKAKASSRWIISGIAACLAAAAGYIICLGKFSVTASVINLTLALTVALLLSLTAVFIRGLQRGIGKTPFGEIVFILLSGLTGGAAWIAANRAFSLTASDNVNAILAADLALTAAISAVFLKEKVSWKAICGILLILTGTMLSLYLV